MSDEPLNKGEWYGWRRFHKGVYQLCTFDRTTVRRGMRVVRRRSPLRVWGTVVKGADGAWWCTYQTVYEGSGVGWGTGREEECPSIPMREAFDRAKLIVEHKTGVDTGLRQRMVDRAAARRNTK